MKTFHFSVRNALLATTFVAAWLGCALNMDAFIEGYDPWGEFVVLYIVIGMPPAALGSILGRPCFGVVCGIAGFMGYFAAIAISWPD